MAQFTKKSLIKALEEYPDNCLIEINAFHPEECMADVPAIDICVTGRDDNNIPSSVVIYSNEDEE